MEEALWPHEIYPHDLYSQWKRPGFVKVRVSNRHGKRLKKVSIKGIMSNCIINFKVKDY